MFQLGNRISEFEVFICVLSCGRRNISGVGTQLFPQIWEPLPDSGARAERRLLPFAVSHAIAGSKQQFKAHIARTLAARRELLPRLERGFMGQAMLGVHDPINPRRRDRLARLVKFPVGIGIHALDRVAWGT